MVVFPFFMDVSDKTFLIVGGGRVAKEKIASLSRFGVRIVVVAEETELGDGLEMVSEAEKSETRALWDGSGSSVGESETVVSSDGLDGSGFSMVVKRKRFEACDLDEVDYVIGATSDRETNRLIADACGKKRLPVNIVDDPELCTFFMPAMVKRGDLTVAISTNGTSPAYARMLREQVEEGIPDEIDGILLRMGKLRPEVLSRVEDSGLRKRLFREMLTRLIETENAITDEEIETMIRSSEEAIRA